MGAMVAKLSCTSVFWTNVNIAHPSCECRFIPAAQDAMRRFRERGLIEENTGRKRPSLSWIDDGAFSGGTKMVSTVVLTPEGDVSFNRIICGPRSGA
jgi:hypothetical protein